MLTLNQGLASQLCFTRMKTKLTLPRIVCKPANRGRCEVDSKHIAPDPPGLSVVDLAIRQIESLFGAQLQTPT